MIKWIECIQGIQHFSQSILHSAKEMVDYLKTDMDGVSSVILPNLQNILEHRFQDNSSITVLQQVKTHSPLVFLQRYFLLSHCDYNMWYVPPGGEQQHLWAVLLCSGFVVFVLFCFALVFNVYVDILGAAILNRILFTCGRNCVTWTFSLDTCAQTGYLGPKRVRIHCKSENHR